VGNYELDGDVAALVVLETVCRSYETAEEAAKVIAVEGRMIAGQKNVMKLHPLVGVERDARAAMLVGLKLLNLAGDEPTKPVGRPPKGAFGAVGRG